MNNKTLAAEIAAGMAVIELTVTLARREAEFQARSEELALERQRRWRANAARRNQS